MGLRSPCLRRTRSGPVGRPAIQWEIARVCLPAASHSAAVPVDRRTVLLCAPLAFRASLRAGDRPFEGWDLATGRADEIRRMAQWFGLTCFCEPGQIDRALATAIIDASGCLVQILASNSWSPGEAVATLARVTR
jgi:hypothetical protein